VILARVRHHFATELPFRLQFIKKHCFLKGALMEHAFLDVFDKLEAQPQPVARHLTAPTYVLKSVAHGSWRPGADPRRFRLAVTRAGLSAEMGDARHTNKNIRH
jgi:hypothetical protein